MMQLKYYLLSLGYNSRHFCSTDNVQRTNVVFTILRATFPLTPTGALQRHLPSFPPLHHHYPTAPQAANIERRDKMKLNHLTVITCSMKKIAEIKGVLGEEIPFEIIHSKLDLEEYQGDPNGDEDFIVKEKCKLAARTIKGPVIVEDTSVIFTALKGLPGPYIKWFDETIGSSGMWRILKDYEDKSATAISKIAFSEGVDQPVHVFEGHLKGTIVEPRGSGFTWTSCFQPDGQTQVFDEMELSLKNTLSERSFAVKKLKVFLLEKYSGNSKVNGSSTQNGNGLSV